MWKNKISQCLSYFVCCEVDQIYVFVFFFFKWAIQFNETINGGMVVKEPFVWVPASGVDDEWMMVINISKLGRKQC